MLFVAFLLFTSHPSMVAQFYSLEGIKQPEIRHGSTDNKPVTEQDSTKRVTAEAAALDSLVREYTRFSLPLDNIYVTSPYGRRKDPFSGKTSVHSGLDLRARNSRVYAMMDGTVIRTGQDRKSGIYVTLQHEDCTVSYCHLSKVLVKKGKKVKAGETVAISGNSGKSTGPHLHITYRVDGKTENPAYLIDGILKRKDEVLEKIRMVGKKPNKG